MDELRVEQEALEAQAMRPLGVSPQLRQEKQQVELAGAETEAATRPVGSVRNLSTASGLRSFIVGASDPFGGDILLWPES